MTTLRDTDEGRRTRSVWPMYVAAVGVGLIGLLLIVDAINNWVPEEVVVYGARCLLGVATLVAAGGLFRPRPSICNLGTPYAFPLPLVRLASPS